MLVLDIGKGANPETNHYVSGLILPVWGGLGLYDAQTFKKSKMKKCLVVWGQIQVSYDGAQAFMPVQYYVEGEMTISELKTKAE